MKDFSSDEKPFEPSLCVAVECVGSLLEFSQIPE